jgi:hypothetical protein
MRITNFIFFIQNVIFKQIFFGMSNSISNLKDGGWGKANVNLRIDNNFCYFLKYLCSPEKGLNRLKLIDLPNRYNNK